MSIKHSDNVYEMHPKPVQESERKISGSAYVDYADQAEVTAMIPIDYRKNKYFWINGALFQCDNDGVTFRATWQTGTSSGTADFTDIYFTI